ncbi:MAG: peptidoglycan DD-metalloendopeptidase family protein [Actinomycetota bacterium]|nr:peptidoglycan DD-metalloendopeptidase family protein [Actinomycetota bacterium]
MAALVAVLGIPAQASTPDDPAPSATVSPLDAQALNVSPAPTIGGTERDTYIVTRADLGNFQPYSNLADTFTNNPDAAIQWPFTVGVPISSGFGYRSCSGCSTYHQGLDFNPGEGTPIQAIADGTVTEIGGPYGTLGVFVKIEHQIDGQRIVSLYAHMLEDSSPLTVGQQVAVGQLVGQVGDTGQSTGPHLHFGLLVSGTEAIDPYPWLKEHAGG